MIVHGSVFTENRAEMCYCESMNRTQCKWWQGLLKLALSLFLFGSFVAADDIAKHFQFEGHIHAQIFSLNTNGKTEILDEFDAPKVQFKGSVIMSDRGARVKTDFVLIGLSQQGQRVKVSLGDKADLNFDLATGAASLEMILDVTLDRARVNIPVKMTTDMIQGPAGPMQGKRANVNHEEHTMVLGMVGGAVLRANVSNSTASALGTKESVTLRQNLVLITGEGQIKALE